MLRRLSGCAYGHTLAAAIGETEALVRLQGDPRSMMGEAAADLQLLGNAVSADEKVKILAGSSTALADSGGVAVMVLG